MRFDDRLFRSVVIASMNMMSNAVNAWWSIVFYSATYAPYFYVRTPLLSVSCFRANIGIRVARHVGYDSYLHFARNLDVWTSVCDC